MAPRPTELIDRWHPSTGAVRRNSRQTGSRRAGTWRRDDSSPPEDARRAPIPTACVSAQKSWWSPRDISDIWNAYTTEEGWTSWAVTHAEMDLRAGGMFRTHYGADAKIGDPGTITLHVVNYVPERLLTLRPELEDRWPDVMKENPENLMSVTVFEPLGSSRTKVLTYRDSAAYDNLMNFFIPANEGLFQKLKDYLER